MQLICGTTSLWVAAGSWGTVWRRAVGTRLRSTGPDQQAGCGLLSTAGARRSCTGLGWPLASCPRSPKTALSRFLRAAQTLTHSPSQWEDGPVRYDGRLQSSLSKHRQSCADTFERRSEGRMFQQLPTRWVWAGSLVLCFVFLFLLRLHLPLI